MSSYFCDGRIVSQFYLLLYLARERTLDSQFVSAEVTGGTLFPTLKAQTVVAKLLVHGRWRVVRTSLKHARLAVCLGNISVVL